MADQVAVWSEAGWGLGSWALVSVLLLASHAVGHLSVPLADVVASIRLPGWITLPASAAVALAAAIGALLLPYQVLRHVPSFKIALVLAGLALIAAAFVAFSRHGLTYDDPRFPRQITGVIMAVGAVAGLAIDGLNRVASQVPTTVVSLLTGIGALLLVGWLYAQDQRQPWGLSLPHRLSIEPPGFHGGSQPTEGESHGGTEEVPGRASGAGDPDGARGAA